MTGRRAVGAWLMAIAITIVAGAALGADAPPVAPSPAFDARLKKLETELRCLVCQNQTLADSNADLAGDLRREVRELALAGKNDAEIRDYLVARYGDFVLYDPPLKRTTWLLWFGPFALLAGGGWTWWQILKRRQRASAAAPTHDPAAEVRARALLDDEPPAYFPHWRRSRYGRASAQALKARAAVPAELEVRRIFLVAGAAEHAARLPALARQRGEHRFGARAVAFVRQPHLRLRDIGRNLADDARRVLVEDVRADAGMLQPVQQQVGVESVQRGVEAFHRWFACAITPRASRQETAALIRRQRCSCQRQASAQMASMSRRARTPSTASARDGSA